MKCSYLATCAQADFALFGQQLSRLSSGRTPARLGTVARCATAEAVADAPADEGATPGVSSIELSENAQFVADNLQDMGLIDLAALSQLLTERLGVSGEGMAMAAGMGAAAPAAAGDGGAVAEAEEPEEQTEFTVKLESFDAGGKIKLIKELRALVDGLGMKEAKDMGYIQVQCDKIYNQTLPHLKASSHQVHVFPQGDETLADRFLLRKPFCAKNMGFVRSNTTGPSVDQVEKAPTVVREAIPKEVADDIKAKLEALGAKVTIS